MSAIKWWTTGVLAIVGYGSAAMAEPAQGTVSLSATATARCGFTDGGQDTNLPLGELTQADGRLDTSKVNGKTASLGGWCSGAGSTISINAGRISRVLLPSSLPSDFSAQIDYQAAVTINGQTAQSQSNVGGSSPVVVGPFAGNITVAMNNAQTVGGANRFLVAGGTYFGQVQITIRAN